MKNQIPTFKEIWFQARREKRKIAATVLMANDEIRKVIIGPRGGVIFLN